MIALSAGRIFDGQALRPGGVVLIDDGRILDIVEVPPPGVATHTLPDGAILAPGYIDLQVNGGGGVLFNDAITPEALRIIATAHARCGTTAILPTLISGSRAQMSQALGAVAAGFGGGVAGLHLEGPFLAPARRGIHPASAMTTANDDDLTMLCRPYPFPLMLTVAPEIVPPSAIARLAQAGVVVMAGHTDANAATIGAALAAGARGFTHLFNAMSPLTGRAPGAVGAALADAHAYAGIIVDGLHVHPQSALIAYRAMGPDRLLLVSDAMATAGSDITHFCVGGVDIHLQAGRLADAAGTLAGAHLTMAEAVQNAIAMVGIAPEDALRMATRTPADCMGWLDRGRIAPGAMADLVALDAGYRVIGVWQQGAQD